jgi:hypothetical protein
MAVGKRPTILGLLHFEGVDMRVACSCWRCFTAAVPTLLQSLELPALEARTGGSGPTFSPFAFCCCCVLGGGWFCIRSVVSATPFVATRFEGFVTTITGPDVKLGVIFSSSFVLSSIPLPPLRASRRCCLRRRSRRAVSRNSTGVRAKLGARAKFLCSKHSDASGGSEFRGGA